MKIKDELKKQYREKKLSEVETIASNLLSSSISNRRDFILALYYLDFTGRYKENLAYKNARFETYINDKFHLRLKTYHKERWAFIKHEKAAISHGPGLVTKVKEKCGAMNVDKVIKKIVKAEKETKKPLPIMSINKIIEKNALPVKEKAIVEPKPVIEAKLYQAEKIIQENNKIKDEKDEQISKLKKTVARLKAENEELRAEVNKYREKEKEFYSIVTPITSFLEREMPARVV